MTIHADVLSALTEVLANTWADELPTNPSWPAIVFEVSTAPEQRWVLGAGYDQHLVTVLSLAKKKSELAALQPGIDAAMEGMDGYLRDEDRGDAEYETDASVYAYFAQYVIRRRR
jgi:hypothetical protein